MISVKKLLTNENLKHTIIIGIGTFFGSFFSYVLQFVLGRYLTVSDYGSFNALLSLSYLLGVPSTVFAISIVKRVAEYTSKNNNAMTTRMFKSLSIFSVLLWLIIFLGLRFLAPEISEKLNIGDTGTVSAFAFYIGLSFLSVIPMSFLQGIMLYRRWAFYSTLSGFLRMLLAAVPAVLGLGLLTVFKGLSLSVIVTYLISILLLSKIFTKGGTEEISGEYKKLFFFGLSTLLISLGLSFTNNIDMVMVKRFFDPETAGYFAGAVTVGKILLFGCTAVATLMFPSISALYAQKKNYFSQLRQLVIIQSLLVAVGLICFQVFPGFITSSFFGGSFMNSVSYLRLYSVFIALYVFVYFFVMFFLAVEKTKVYFLLIPGVILQYFLINRFNSSVNEVIYSDIAAVSLTLVLLLSYLAILARKSRIS